jgi:hypothetical protein
MANPFLDFHSVPFQKKKKRPDHMTRSRQELADRILKSYTDLVGEEVKDLGWLIEPARALRAYSAATASIQELDYDQNDIEDFCAELDISDRVRYMISGPAGIFISALVNNAKEDRITLGRASKSKYPYGSAAFYAREDRITLAQISLREFHFLGYKLPEGKVLTIQGDVGDFAGAGLAGGRLIIEGNAGNWCGVGMTKGKITVAKSAGKDLGAWMQGGELHVDSRIWSLAKSCSAGRIYHHGKLVFPRRTRGEKL